MVIRLFNTDGRSIQEFKPIEAGRVGVYACGPTVYNYSHIGNMRAYIWEDLLRRTLERAGFEVRHVMNVTDVGHLAGDADEGEDKMIRSAREKGMSVWDIAEFFTRAFFDDCERLEILRPHVVCRATDHIADMIALIERLVARGLTYTAGGNLYFDISKFPGYGRLALLDRQELQAGARVDVDPNKRNPHDFALWFTNSKFDRQAMIWDSPWGRGYPGWHIECSAMSMRYLGERFDIHCGGVDHIAVHHTNEIAQSEGATGAKWVNFWLHGEFIVMNDGKMAKSKGEFLTLSNLVERGYDPLDYRYFCVGGHYRSQLQFSFEALDGARSARQGLAARVARLLDEAPGGAAGALSAAAEALRAEFDEALGADLGTPKALSVLWKAVKEEAIPAAERLALVHEMDKVLALGLNRVERESRDIDEESLRLIREREDARKHRDFARADAIRTQLKERGISLEDTPAGTAWVRSKSV